MTARPQLSVVGITANSSDRLERWAALAREYADEISLLVDAASDEETVQMARRVADHVEVVEHPPFIEVAMDWGLRAGRGEWVLWLDDDEVLAPGFPDRLDELLADTEVTHYLQPYRWVVRHGEGYGWLATFPWHPNPRLRLIRRTGSVFSHRGRLHSPVDVQGEGRVLTDDDTAIYHLDFVLRDRAARERKVRRYRGHPAPSCEEYYLWEDYASTVEVIPLDATIIEREPTAAASARAAVVSATPAGREPTAAAEAPPVPLERLRAAIARYWPNADVFSATYGPHTVPARVLANRGYTAELEITNTSALRWRTTGPDAGRVELSYHWIHPIYGMLLRDGDVTLLPGVVDAGATVRMAVGFWTPYDPGRYRLEWDLRCNGVKWFSERGVAPLSIEIEVENRDRLLPTPRSVARLPARGRPAVMGAPAPSSTTAERAPSPATVRRLRAALGGSSERAAPTQSPPPEATTGPPSPAAAGRLRAAAKGLPGATAGVGRLRAAAKGLPGATAGVGRLRAAAKGLPGATAGVGRLRAAAKGLPGATAGVGRLGPSRPGGRLASRRRTSRRAIPGIPSGANVVPIKPVRVLDTRDGSGVPGAPVGPIQAGTVVTLDVTRHPSIPDTAVGVVGNLSVPASDFNGFASAYAADGTAGDGTVSIYFNDRGEATVNQVLSALGVGSEAGRLSISVSAGTGTVQLLLDVAAYLD